MFLTLSGFLTIKLEVPTQTFLPLPASACAWETVWTQWEQFLPPCFTLLLLCCCHFLEKTLLSLEYYIPRFANVSLGVMFSLGSIKLLGLWCMFYMEREHPALPNSVLYHPELALLMHKTPLQIMLVTVHLTHYLMRWQLRHKMSYLIPSIVLNFPPGTYEPASAPKSKSSPSAPKQKSLWITTWADPCLWVTSLIFPVFIYLYSFSQAHAATHSWSCEVITTRALRHHQGLVMTAVIGHWRW